MRRTLTKLLSEDHPLIEKRSCKRRDNNERPKYQNVRVSFSSAALSFDSVLAVARAEHCRSGWGVLSFVSSFYGNRGAKFPAERRIAKAGPCLKIRKTSLLKLFLLADPDRESAIY
jgi:hypothetical protein